MAQSIYEVMADRKLEVVDGKDTFSVDVPKWFPKSLEDKAAFKELEQEAILAKAMAQMIIDLRAEARKGNAKDSEKTPQELVDDYTPKAPRRAKTKAELIAELFAGMSDEEKAAILKMAESK